MIDSEIEVQTNSKDTSIIRRYEGSIIALLSALLIFMLLVDWAMSPFVNNSLRLDIHIADYENAYEGQERKSVMFNGKRTMDRTQEACIGIYDFQTEQSKSKETTLVTLVPIRKILE